MVYHDIKMQYLWRNGNRYYCKSKHLPTYLLCTLWHHVFVSEKNGTLWTHTLYFDNNNLYLVDITRYNNIFECIVVYRDIFLQCCDIAIQKISYRGITNVHSELDAVKPLNNGHFGTSWFWYRDIRENIIMYFPQLQWIKPSCQLHKIKSGDHFVSM